MKNKIMDVEEGVNVNNPQNHQQEMQD